MVIATDLYATLHKNLLPVDDSFCPVEKPHPTHPSHPPHPSYPPHPPHYAAKPPPGRIGNKGFKYKKNRVIHSFEIIMYT
ncbi:hypothetical protein QTP88_025890 [Uroleucon formosanum]